MATTHALRIDLGDGGVLDLVVEQPDTGSAVTRLTLAGRTYHVVATRDEGLDGEPATWHAEVDGGNGAARAAGDAATNLGYVSADEALEATARRLAEATER